MKPKIFNWLLFALLTVFAVNTGSFAQVAPDTVQQSQVCPETSGRNKTLQLSLDGLNLSLKTGLKTLEKNLELTLNNVSPEIKIELDKIDKDLNFSFSDIAPEVKLDLKSLGKSFSFSYSDCNPQCDQEDKVQIDKFKSYSKSYPLNGGDKIKLSNQYGKIAVNTWDKHEVKVDVQIKASAGDEDLAQKLLDGVQIHDSKDGNQVSFRTSIEMGTNGSWKVWEWHGKKNHKLEINYTVFMPAKTDLNVEDSYGAIELPDLAGKIKISSSYGSVSAENLSNPANEIEGSYGSLKIESLNGAHLEYSYGSVDLEECNNLKSDLSYGSFKLGKLKGVADFDLSYVGGFKIEEIGTSFKKLNINASYSGVTIGVPDNNNFDFDITTTYGGFNANDNKVVITSKTPADGSRHVSMTKNYKGHFGKEGAEAQVSIHSTYGGVSFN